MCLVRQGKPCHRSPSRFSVANFNLTGNFFTLLPLVAGRIPKLVTVGDSGAFTAGFWELSRASPKSAKGGQNSLPNDIIRMPGCPYHFWQTLTMSEIAGRPSQGGIGKGKQGSPDLITFYSESPSLLLRAQGQRPFIRKDHLVSNLVTQLHRLSGQG